MQLCIQQEQNKYFHTFDNWAHWFFSYGSVYSQYSILLIATVLSVRVDNSKFKGDYLQVIYITDTVWQMDQSHDERVKDGGSSNQKVMVHGP